MDGTSFVLQDANGAVVPAAVTYDAVARRATLDPTDPLASSTRYTVSLKNTITDPLGQRLRRRHLGVQHGRYRRSDRDNADTRGRATAVAAGTNVTATFSEAVQAVSGTTFTLTEAPELPFRGGQVQRRHPGCHTGPDG